METAKRERNTGRYAYKDLEIPCRCGHTLGQHLAERAKCSDGITRQDCLENGCNCECFRKVGKKMENQTNKNTKKPEIATPVVSSQRIDHQAQEPKLVTKMNPGIPDWLQWSADEEAMLTEEAAWILIPQIRAYIKSNEAEIQKLQGLVDKAKQLQLDLMPKLGFAAPSVAPTNEDKPKRGKPPGTKNADRTDMPKWTTGILESLKDAPKTFTYKELTALVEKRNVLVGDSQKVSEAQLKLAWADADFKAKFMKAPGSPEKGPKSTWMLK